VRQFGDNTFEANLADPTRILVSTMIYDSQDQPSNIFTNLVWEDDFSGATLDYTKWECEVNAFGGGNNELQLYTDHPENVWVRVYQ
jgi:hypothetical protein